MATNRPRKQAYAQTASTGGADQPQHDFERGTGKAHDAMAKPWLLGHATLPQIGSLVLYTCVAVAMNFINKYTMVIYPLPNVVLILQMLCSLVLLVPLHCARLLHFPLLSPARMRLLFPMTVLYTSNTALALFGLRTLNVPMYSTLKRLTPIIVLAAKVAWTRRLPSAPILGSVLLVVCGCIVAGYGDLSFNLMGYSFALMSCLLQAMYLVLVEIQGSQGITTAEMLYYNALTSLPLLITVVHCLGEDRIARPTYHEAVALHGAATTISALMMCASGGILLNFSMFLCTVHNSALTTTVFGVLRGVAIVLLGFFLLGGVKFSWINVFGMSLNLVGGVWYSAIKFHASSSAVAEHSSPRAAEGNGHASHHPVMLTKAPHMIVSPSADTMGYGMGMGDQQSDDERYNTLAGYGDDATAYIGSSAAPAAGRSAASPPTAAAAAAAAFGGFSLLFSNPVVGQSSSNSDGVGAGEKSQISALTPRFSPPPSHQPTSHLLHSVGETDDMFTNRPVGRHSRKGSEQVAGQDVWDSPSRAGQHHHRSPSQGDVHSREFGGMNRTPSSLDTSPSGAGRDDKSL